MIVNQISLRNFRNYSSLDINFNSRLIFFVGENGEGKTNFLESIQMLSTLKSFRENSEDEILSWNDETFYVGSEITTNSGEIKLELGYTKKDSKRKKIKINGQETNKKIEFIGNLVTVVYTPLDLKIVDGGPIERRKFMDAILSMVDKKYLVNLLEYNKVLKHRNSLLKEKYHQEEMDPWEQMLVERGVFLIQERRKLLSNINENFKSNLAELSGNKDNFLLKYLPNIKDESIFINVLHSKREIDKRLGYTTVGPHRDELFIGIENRDITEFGSQGQKRSTVISLKTAQFQFIKDKTGEIPILLIDDVIRELDVKRREHFVNLLLNSGQAFFTTTDLEGIKEYMGNFQEKVQIFKVKAGHMSEEKIDAL